MPDWPQLDVARDQPSFATLHLVSQMLGKLRVAHAPWVNHGWHATLHPRPDGLAIVRTLVEQAAARGVAFLALEIGMGQAPAVALLMRAAGFARTETRPDLAGIDRVVAAWR